MPRPYRIRDYQYSDEPSWLRCRALSFLGSAYFDDVKTRRTVFEGDAIRLVAVHPKPGGITTPGEDEVIGVLDVELWTADGEPAATIDTVAVHPDHARRGIASALLAEALDRLARTPAAWLDAWTREDEAANAWYGASGFAVESAYLHVYKADAEPDDGFATPAGLSVPVTAFMHGDLADGARWRGRFARVYECRRYLRPLSPALWPADPELAALYDIECAGREDHDYYLALAVRLGAGRVTDIGCGTGVLAVEMASAGHEVTGLDPARAMLDIARARGGGDRVTWVEGYAGALADSSADLVLMEGHVAQYFVADDAWGHVLAQAFRALAPGGHLAFESRNPARRAWEGWTAEGTRATYPHPDGGAFTSWGEVERVVDHGDGRFTVTTAGVNLLPDGSRRDAVETLTFRTREHLEDSLAHAGFEVVRIAGDWDDSPASADSAELIVLARKPGEA